MPGATTNGSVVVVGGSVVVVLVEVDDAVVAGTFDTVVSPPTSVASGDASLEAAVPALLLQAPSAVIMHAVIVHAVIMNDRLMTNNNEHAPRRAAARWATGGVLITPPACRLDRPITSRAVR
jgi:hypothetical protein